MTTMQRHVSVEPFVVRKRRINVPVAWATLTLVIVVFAMHWDDLAAGGLNSALVPSLVIVSGGLALSLWVVARSTQLTIHSDRIESASGLTGRVYAVHRPEDIEHYYVYRRISGGVGYAEADRWTVRVAYRDGLYDDLEADALNAKQLVAYLAVLRVPRIDAPPVEDERSTSNWARVTGRTGTSTRTVVRVLAAITIMIAMAGLLFFVQELRSAGASSSWPTVAGRVTHSAVWYGGSPSSPRYRPSVRYEYQVGGRIYQGTRIGFGTNETSDSVLARAMSAHYAVGTPVAVHYDPARPASAVLEPTPDPMRWGNIVLSVAIICFGLYALFVRIPPYWQPPL